MPTPLRRALGGLVLALALVAAAPAPLRAAEAIERFRAEIAVARDGRLTVTETIRVRAEGSAIRRGIFRDFPLAFDDAEGRRREVGFRLIDVSRDGRPEPHFTERHGDVLRIYAGAADVFLRPGVYTYRLAYETDRQIRWFDGAAELFWNVTGNFWSFPILAAEARLTLADGAAPLRWTAYTGRLGARGTDWRAGLGGDGSLEVRTTQRLAPGEGLSFVAALPDGAVARPDAGAELRWFWRDNRRWLIAGAGFAAVLLYYLWSWRAVGRDPRRGTIIPLFHPPKGVSPALANYVRNWGFGGEGWRAFTAAALSLAVRGLLLFEEADGDLTLKARRMAPEAERRALPPGERAVLAWVDAEGGTAEIRKSNGEAVAKAGEAFRTAIAAENRNRFFRRNLLHAFGGVALSAAALALLFLFGGLDEADIAVFIPLAVVGIVVGVVLVPTLRKVFVEAALPTLIRAAMSVIAVIAMLLFATGEWLIDGGDVGGLLAFFAEALGDNPFPFFVAFAFPAVNGLFLWLLRAPTPLGAKVMDELEGLRLYLATAESGRLNLAAAPEITAERFEALLPYAVALDVEEPWAEAFAAALARARPDAEPDYRPSWSSGRSWSGRGIGRAVTGSVAGATAALAASVPRASSSSSGFSSSGGSGGGGGGGGGGGW